MRIRGLGRLRQMGRSIRSRFRSEAVILMYHRVARVPSDPWSLCVTPEHFAEHLEVLRSYGRPVPLAQLAQAVREDTLPHRSIAITFDDGYADNLIHAKPLLEQYDMPATVFLTSGYVGNSREFWWDDLERIVLGPTAVPKQLHLQIQGTSYQWKLKVYDSDVNGYDGQSHTDNGPSKDGALSRHALYRSLHSLLKPLLDGPRYQVMEKLMHWANVQSAVRETHRVLSLEEVVQLRSNDLVEIGAHTVTHPILSSLTISEQQSEIQKSKDDLENILGRSVTTFAYPFGSLQDFRQETVDIVRNAGFSCACSTVRDVVSGHSDTFQLTRFAVGDWDGETLATRLKHWFSGRASEAI